MPQFAPGATKTAKVTLTNPTAKQFTYSVELYLGVAKAATSGVGTVTIPAGGSIDAQFTVVMPSAGGDYPVYLDVWSDTTLLKHYQATEDVVIVTPPFSISFYYVFYYLYDRLASLGPGDGTGLMGYGSMVDHIGFALGNTSTQDIPGVSVKFRVDSTELSSPLDQFLNPFSQPFTLAASDTKWIYYSWSPSLAHYRAVAEVWVNNQLVYTKAIEFDVQY